MIAQDRSSILVIVGRTDTGGLEAQTRGSRHAWDIRLVSIQALTSLLKVKENLSDLAILHQTQEIFKPLEFTRLDSLIEIVFKTSEATGQSDADESLPEPALLGSTGEVPALARPAIHQAAQWRW